jgi:hypothetical protein
MSRLKNYLLGAGVAVGAMVLGVGVPAAAAAVHVGPGQVFSGEVNGKSTGAEIVVGCFGAIHPGQMGHPVSGQTVDITAAASVATSAGFTGSLANRVTVTAEIPISSTLIVVEHWPVTLRTYGTRGAIPTAVEVPCAGTGTVSFNPKPASARARSANVRVTFVSIGLLHLKTTTAPHITARPTDVMVNSPVALHGIGFPPAATLRLQECSLKNWIVPEDPCLNANSVTVTTNSRGEFTTTMKALICPAVTLPVVTERTCYIGVPRPSGIDTITLLSAARIVVSWP